MGRKIPATAFRNIGVFSSSTRSGVEGSASSSLSTALSGCSFLGLMMTMFLFQPMLSVS